MTKEIINTCEYYKICESACGGTLEDTELCSCYQLYKQLKRLEQERDKLKAELHSKVEFIQEQRTIINEYVKEIEIYKQCQGKRASKREEELKQVNKELKEKYTHVLELAKTNADSNEYCLQELEKENKELKNIIKIHDSTKYDYYKLMKENEEWHIKYAGCNTANSAIQEENKKYRSALEEIKELAKNGNAIDGIRLKIIDKITEVLGNESN